jgi:CRP/FNR family cyclic AMP-dependent transcriptional regulator
MAGFSSLTTLSQRRWNMTDLIEFITELDRAGWVQIAGYFASGLVFLTFCMSTLIPLRLIAIASNIAFIVYALLGNLVPILLLHGALLPLNVLRTIQQLIMFRRVRAAFRDRVEVDALVPFMRLKKFKQGTVLFRKSDRANQIFLLNKGQVLIPEIGKLLPPGTLFGEIGLFTPDHTRTASAVCHGDCEVYVIGEDDLVQLCLNDRAFGLLITKLIAGRMTENQGRLEAAMAAEMLGDLDQPFEDISRRRAKGARLREKVRQP